MNKMFSKVFERKKIINAICVASVFFFAILSFIPLMNPISSNFNLLNQNSKLSTIFKLLVFSCLLLIVFVGLLVNKIKLDKKLLILLGIYFGLSIFPNLFLNEKIIVSIGERNTIYEPTLFSLIDSSIFCIRTIVMVIFYTELLPEIATKKLLVNILNCFIAFALFAVIYLFVFQFNYIANFFKSSDTINNNALSFFTNKNSFGVVLAGSIALCLILITYTDKKLIYWLLICVFYLTSLSVLARTSLIASTVLIVAYVFSNFIVRRKYKIPFIILISLICLTIAYIIVLYSSEPFRKLTFNSKVHSIIERFVTDADSATGRSHIWNLTFDFLLDPIRLVFGYGDKISNTVLNLLITSDRSVFGTTSSFHNAILNNIVSGGILRFSIYLFIIYYIFFKKHDFTYVKYTIIFVSIIIPYILIEFFEEVILFETSLNSNLWTLIICSPLIFECTKLRDHEQVENKDITICVATINKNYDQIIELINENHLCGNIIVGCQGAKEEKILTYKTEEIDAKIYFQTSIGVSKNRNYLLSKIDTKYFIFLDDDITLLDNALNIICNQINISCDADLLFFHLKYKDQRVRKIKHTKYFKWIDARSFGINSIVFRNEFIKENSIKFNEKIGPGCEISSGEDGQFAMAVAKKSNSSYKCEKTIIEISYENGSSWFKGYEKSYFINIGYTYSMCYGIFAKIFGIYTLIKHKEKYLVDLSFKEAFGFIKEGVRKYKHDK